MPTPSKTDARRATKQAATKLTYRDKYALEQLPVEIDALRAEIVACQKQLDDPTLYARDAEQFAAWAEKLSQARDRLEKAEEEWLALEIRREEIEAMETRCLTFCPMTTMTLQIHVCS